MDLEQWNEAANEGKNISLGELDKLVESWKLACIKYEEAKEISKKLNEEAESLKFKIVGILKAAGKKKYAVDGIGLIYTTSKLAVTTPKDNGSKRLLFDYINNVHGHETLTGMLSIHYATLNSFYNKEAEAAAKEGIADFSIPGLDQPTEQITLNFRSETK